MPDDEVQNHEPKISLPEAILVGLLIFFIGLLGEVPIIGPLFDFSFTQIYLGMKGMKGSYQLAMLGSNVAMIILSAIGLGFLEAFSDTITFGVLVWMDHHPKTAKLAVATVGVGAAVGATVATGGLAAPATVPAAVGAGGGAAAAGAVGAEAALEGGALAAGAGAASAETAGGAAAELGGGSLGGVPEGAMRFGAEGAETGQEGLNISTEGTESVKKKPRDTSKGKGWRKNVSDVNDALSNVGSDEDNASEGDEQETPSSSRLMDTGEEAERGNVSLGNDGSVDLREAA